MSVILECLSYTNSQIENIINFYTDTNYKNQLQVEYVENVDIMFAHRLLDDEDPKLFIVKQFLTVENECIWDLLVRACQSNTIDVISEGSRPPFISWSKIHKTRTRYYNFGPGTGIFKPGVTLIVGERPGEKKSLGHRDAAFFSVEKSSAWLRSNIAKLGPYYLFNTYWVNAFDRNDTATDFSFIDRLKPSKIVALGGVAYNELRKQNVENVEKIPHPSYWRRFKSKQVYPLLTFLSK